MGRKGKKYKKKEKKKAEDVSEKIEYKEDEIRDTDPSLPKIFRFHQNEFGKFPNKFALKSDQCYILVVDDPKTIFFWKGANSNVRSKFIGSKKCSEIQHQLRAIEKHYYKIISQDEGYEDPNFLKFFKDNRGPGTPFPYIPNPPKPPDDLDAAGQVQIKRKKPPKEFTITRFCEHCGAPLENGVSVCPNCGKKI